VPIFALKNFGHKKTPGFHRIFFSDSILKKGNKRRQNFCLVIEDRAQRTRIKNDVVRSSELPSKIVRVRTSVAGTWVDSVYVEVSFSQNTRFEVSWLARHVHGSVLSWVALTDADRSKVQSAFSATGNKRK